MTATYRQRFLGVLARAERDFADVFAALNDQITVELARAAGGDGTIPPARAQAVRDEVGARVTATFLGIARGQGTPAYRPFQVQLGRVLPLSPYMATLWGHIEDVTRLAVDQHAAMMHQRLAGAPDVRRALERATRNPFAQRVAEQADYNPRPFLAYDPPHRWVRPDGYTLSDRIWRTAGDMRRQIDRVLAEGIAQGKGALQIAKDLEPYLQPGRVGRLTRKPYGTRASYDAMRLARTEITAAHTRAGLMSANLNPFVSGYRVALSRQHPQPDICDTVVAGGPYALDDVVNLPPLHPHCLCTVLWETAISPEDAIQALREQMAMQIGPTAPGDLLVDMIGPLLADKLVQILLGDWHTSED